MIQVSRSDLSDLLLQRSGCGHVMFQEAVHDNARSINSWLMLIFFVCVKLIDDYLCFCDDPSA